MLMETQSKSIYPSKATITQYHFTELTHTCTCMDSRPSKELRERLARDAKQHAEKAKIVIRRIRQKAISSLRKNDEPISKDSLKRIEELVRVTYPQLTLNLLLLLLHRYRVSLMNILIKLNSY